MLWLILGVLSPFYLFAPLVTWATQRLPVIPMRRLGEVPEAVAPLLAEWEAQLGGTGVSLMAIHQTMPDSGSPHWNPGNAGYVLHLADRTWRFHALHYVTPRAQWRVFVTELANGEEVATGAVAAPDIHTRDPRVHGLRVGAAYDLRRLHALHLAHVEHVVGPGAVGVMRQGDALMDMVPQRERGFLERQHEMGVLAARGGLYRPTLASAFLWTWRLLPPLAQIRRMRHDRLRRTLEAAIRDRGRTG